MQKYQAASLSEAVKLTTANYTVSMNCKLSPITENHTIVFVIWSDKKHEYVCIEPVIGNQPAQDGLPTPLILVKNEELVMVFTIIATRAGFVVPS
jgi:galactose mutarotase-like enzyme